jgi:hypothetical protein
VKHAPIARDRYTGVPTNYVQLLQSISHARSMERLASLVRDFGDKFDAVHVSAAMVVVPRLLADALEGSRPLDKGATKAAFSLMAQLQVGGRVALWGRVFVEAGFCGGARWGGGGGAWHAVVTPRAGPHAQLLPGTSLQPRPYGCSVRCSSV